MFPLSMRIIRRHLRKILNEDIHSSESLKEDIQGGYDDTRPANGDSRGGRGSSCARARCRASRRRQEGVSAGAARLAKGAVLLAHSYCRE